MMRLARKKAGNKAGKAKGAVVPRPPPPPPPSPGGGGVRYAMPPEEGPHEGTWLQWPHDRGYDRRHHVRRYERTWVQMTRALHVGEMVHIVAYDEEERRRIEAVLLADDADPDGDGGDGERGSSSAGGGGAVDMSWISFHLFKTDDVWIRDNGPIFVRDLEEGGSGRLVITNWGFNGWGGRTSYRHCNEIPSLVGKATGIPCVDVPMVNEGGSIDVDGRGTLIAKRSSILNANRNPGWTQEDAEVYFTTFLGVTNFIWLDGVGGQDITDDHIDGTARFANGDTMVTYSRRDSVDPAEYDALSRATDVHGQRYKMVHLPLTKRRPRGVKEEGTYVNYYVGNEVVLVPSYGDPGDEVARDVIRWLYPTWTVVGIDAIELARDGGMVHCVTQQQPLA